VLVTGAASGIGRETALILSKNNFYVYAVDLNEEGLDKVFRGIENVKTIRCDLTNKKDIQNLFRIVKEGKVDDDESSSFVFTFSSHFFFFIFSEGRGLWGLANIAGIGQFLPSLTHDEDSARRMFDVNFWAST